MSDPQNNDEHRPRPRTSTPADPEPRARPLEEVGADAATAPTLATREIYRRRFEDLFLRLPTMTYGQGCEAVDELVLQVWRDAQGQLYTWLHGVMDELEAAFRPASPT